MYKKKGLGLLWAEKKETSRRLILLTTRLVPDVMLFLPAGRVPDMQWLELYVLFLTCRQFLTCKSIRTISGQSNSDSEIPRRYLDSWNLDSQKPG